MSNIQKITVAGGGVLGAQIAFQTAFHGFAVSVYDVSEEAFENTFKIIKQLGERYKKDLGATEDSIIKARDQIKFSTDLGKSVQDADLLIEAIPENPKIKTDFYQKFSKLAPAKTIFATNSSTLLPSQFADATGRPEKFLALHFANEIWIHNTAEIMGHPKTDPKIYEEVVTFAKSIGMVALPLKKEQPGYILNSLLVPLLASATQLLANEVADPQTIDKTWMIATGAPMGPFGILDVVGITTAYNINKIAAEATKDPLKIKTAELLKANFIDKGKLGVSTGEGFYKYPNPEYQKKDFLKA